MCTHLTFVLPQNSPVLRRASDSCRIVYKRWSRLCKSVTISLLLNSGCVQTGAHAHTHKQYTLCFKIPFNSFGTEKESRGGSKVVARLQRHCSISWKDTKRRPQIPTSSQKKKKKGFWTPRRKGGSLVYRGRLIDWMILMFEGGRWIWLFHKADGSPLLPCKSPRRHLRAERWL